jgi:hypothetical protein
MGVLLQTGPKKKRGYTGVFSDRAESSSSFAPTGT